MLKVKSAVPMVPSSPKGRARIQGSFL